ncbi:MAG: response regulator transcription factor [Clostridiales bacterium]|nr:response regulator transcription factor [Clostridiales bacterium]
MYNIAICDDEVKTLEDMSTTIKNEFSKLRIDGKYFSTSYPEKLLEILDKENIDVLFLDIDMPKITGMDIGEYLLNTEKDILLIFVTSHNALVYKSFKYHPFGFIRKDYFNEEISQVIESIYLKFQEKIDYMTIKINNEIIKIKLSDILYFEGESNYVNLYTKKEKYRYRDTLTSLEENLHNKGFLRVHKGYLISAKEVFLIKGKEVKLYDGTIIPIGRCYSESTKKDLMKFMR